MHSNLVTSGPFTTIKRGNNILLECTISSPGVILRIAYFSNPISSTWWRATEVVKSQDQLTFRLLPCHGKILNHHLVSPILPLTASPTASYGMEGPESENNFFIL